jgi:hypothetical protein
MEKTHSIFFRGSAMKARRVITSERKRRTEESRWFEEKFGMVERMIRRKSREKKTNLEGG